MLPSLAVIYVRSVLWPFYSMGSILMGLLVGKGPTNLIKTTLIQFCPLRCPISGFNSPQCHKFSRIGSLLSFLRHHLMSSVRLSGPWLTPTILDPDWLTLIT